MQNDDMQQKAIDAAVFLMVNGNLLLDKQGNIVHCDHRGLLGSIPSLEFAPDMQRSEYDAQWAEFKQSLGGKPC